LGVGLLAGLLAAPVVAEEWTELRFERLDRAYHNLATDFSPVERGVFVVTLSSPENVLVLRRHLVRLRPVDGGRYRAELELEIEGSGRVVADVEVGDSSSRFVDDILVPPQRFVVPGEVALEIRPSGLAITLVEIPPAVAVTIESGLGRQFGTACAAIPLLPCAGMEELFGRLRVPLPAAGTTFILPRSEVEEEEWGVVVGLLDRGR